ncbi:MAG: formyltransferase family protein [Sulfurovum sp.]
MIIAIFTNECPIQNALVYKIIKDIEIDTVFKSRNIINNLTKKSFLYYLKRLIRIPFEMPFRLAWNRLIKVYHKKYPYISTEVKQYLVNNINDDIVIRYIKERKPELIVVSATTMVKDEIINEAKNINCLILNLHTGVSPYIKGGPNCTNWCLSNNYYLIGNTIMRLDIGIDSGAIIATECTILNGDESLFELHYKVMEHGFDLYLRVISCYRRDKTLLNATSQDDISQNTTLFYTKDWTITKVIKAYYNYKFFYKKGINSFKLDYNIKLFPFVCKE